ncbi:hypothetical protein CBR_g19306 [Chara braunii]|uniref:Uncharacterized protein n=1 Tax=Chara braunii TaxID=69332 RepID=A0A388KXK9_CHABU|nr:hypothetical protein CBR_g19306 [Chara braunii]|eukprot:GBG74794.1 hypothetical protein CBR_g19306 [Chara braunii]
MLFTAAMPLAISSDGYRLLDEEECAPFTDVYWLKFVHISNARFAKRKLDDYKFLGNIIKVTYAPEQESPSETRAKLEERCRIVLRRMEKLEAERTAMSLHAAGCLPSSASTTLDRSEWKHDAHFFPSFDSSVDSYPYEPTPLERLPRPSSDHAGSVSLYGPHRDPLIGPSTSAARSPVGVPTSVEKGKDGGTSRGGTASQAKGTISRGKVTPKFIGPRKAPSSGAVQVCGHGPGAGSQLDARPSVSHPTAPEAPTDSIASIATDPKYYQSASMNETVLSIRQKLEAVSKSSAHEPICTKSAPLSYEAIQEHSGTLIRL